MWKWSGWVEEESRVGWREGGARRQGEGRRFPKQVTKQLGERLLLNPLFRSMKSNE